MFCYFWEIRMDRELAIIDKVTGEIVGDYKPKSKHRHYHYHLTFYSAYAKATKDASQLIIGQMDNKNRIALNKDKITTLAANYGISPSTIKMTACRMCSAGLMMRLAPALYFANPYYFTKTSIFRVEELRKEYSELLFSTCNKAKRDTPTQKEAKRVKQLETQIKDILANPSVNRILND